MPTPRAPSLGRLAARSALAGGLVLLAGIAAYAVGQPWLFPSLGPTAAVQVGMPEQDAARPWNTLVGHAVGVVAGFVAVAVTGAGDAAVGLTGAPDASRVLAAAIAVAFTFFGNFALRAFHPPAAATTLLIALGGVPPTTAGAGAVAVGVGIVAGAGEIARRGITRGATG